MCTQKIVAFFSLLTPFIWFTWLTYVAILPMCAILGRLVCMECLSRALSTFFNSSVTFLTFSISNYLGFALRFFRHDYR
ncbi:hypothetical protein GLOIN_2v1629306 [Rhizophagus irregularis DAOM 181602=DAOM 197198]|uniref:Uncharacterized protein n=1 Tax=Rhizophagus irregularis (strain DAOM 181602 / DAOM 197198 / MUCL 43194) TaxID=747089 RepID=A0A2P4PV27_RHIID|nr:hypothetical protein GLOIN_2v1629306 [Rhizophagus irregularis DAOM 181602=DAOM 197198]POG69245.1 hypothetical protein GLOIN_2v1629306 [Rhizophagus irregularis DAOM 181602=DAOM 197198]|eukprot:XP_025176111.1 hypothetical protein GLOIN_2v1629306 [Rhizophagus irregularis DAOM 181602=DAOM 197198]